MASALCGGAERLYNLEQLLTRHTCYNRTDRIPEDKQSNAQN